jgi:hypothetical protein
VPMSSWLLEVPTMTVVGMTGTTTTTLRLLLSRPKAKIVSLVRDPYYRSRLLGLIDASELLTTVFFLIGVRRQQGGRRCQSGGSRTRR